MFVDTPLHLACYAGQADVVRFLLGAFPASDLSLENVFGEDILCAACTHGRDTALVTWLLKLPGIEVNRQGADGHTGTSAVACVAIFEYS